MRGKFIIILAVIVAVVLVLVAVKRRQASQWAPRYVVFICIDAVRPDHLGCYGYHRDTSPRLDDLAARGALFEDAVTQAPWTLPSIATVLSSTFPSQHGARRTGGSQAVYSGLEHNFIETLMNAGFKTSLFTGGLTLESKMPSPDLSLAAIDWLRDNLKHDCFAVIHHYDTHSPYIASPSCILKLDPGYSGRFSYMFNDMEVLRQARVGRLGEVLQLSTDEIEHIAALYDCQIMRADESIGMIADSLEAWGRLDESMIIVFADHGEEFLEHGSIDHGQTVYEEVLRVPLVIFCPSLIDLPVRVPEQVGLIDLGPTILDALGFKPEEHFEGRSLMPLISSRFDGQAVHVRPSGLPADCLVSEAIARRSERKALRRPPWKLIYDPFFGPLELYDIVKDPLEQENLIDINPGIAAALTDSLLVMSRYYPGGWCVAWQSPRTGGKVRGMVKVQTGIIEALAHNFFPEVDASTDTLMISKERKAVRFVATPGDGWQGVEIRMPAGTKAQVELSIAGRSRIRTMLGPGGESTEFPITVSADQARIDRRHIGRLFESQEVECAVYWIDPGTEPTARQMRQAELRKQLRSIGYID
ncbi:sulfatase [Candidatus Eisenbacteria bacterium]|uniref:Sulfatase n=1 Tax=Eiseniibacteriota bacterium TaxID=2212470 RepID=A0ABV6YNB4_UNCEI